VRARGYLPVSREVQLEGGATALVDVALVPDRPHPAPAPPLAAPARPGGAAAQPTPAGEKAPTEASDSEGADHSHAGESHHHHHGHHVPSSADSSPSGTAPSSTPQPRRPAVAPDTPGTLGINSVPWALVYIDGRDTGRSTPLLGYPIAPGWHEVRLQTANGQVDIERIQVLPGQTVNLTRRF
jgi:eukaryotic-like serine/threonine-protein kinase